MNALVRDAHGVELVDPATLNAGHLPAIFEHTRAHATFVSVHPRIQKWGAALAAWMLVVAWIGFSGTATINIAIAISVVTLVMYLGVPLILARTSRYVTPQTSFGDYLEGELETYGGAISGREAMIQVLTVPACLAVGLTLMAGLWLWLS
jgi:ACR3 family arsenite efflux pump ArsB